MFAFFTVLLIGWASLCAAEKGIVELDSWTFDKIVDGSRNVLVKFDKSYSHGDKVLLSTPIRRNYRIALFYHMLTDS